MKQYVFYATEETCFETDKIVSENPIEEVKELLKNDGVTEEEIGEVVNELTVDYSKNGYALSSAESCRHYLILIGIACHGKCRPVTSDISYMRRQYI